MEKVAILQVIGPMVAIVGVAGRFPGADDVGRFWQNMRAGVTSIARFTDAELEDRHGIHGGDVEAAGSGTAEGATGEAVDG